MIKWRRYITQGFMDWRKIKRTSYQNLDDLQNLLRKLTVKARVVKAWLLYEFPFSLIPCDKPNDAQKSKSYSSLYAAITEDQFQACSKKKVRYITGRNIKPTKYYLYFASQKKYKHETLYEEHNSKTFIKIFHKVVWWIEGYEPKIRYVV